MKRTILNLVISAPIAAAALTMTPGVALADEGPIIVLPPADPGDGPDDKDGPGTDPVDHDGPGGITAPQPCPTHGVDCTPDDDDKGDEPGEPGKPGDEPGHNGGNNGGGTVESVALPTRIDAGIAPVQDESGLALSWLLTSGALVTASGAAFAARRVRSRA